MDQDVLDRDLAETYAGWFRALADPSRVQILHLLASAGRPMPVGEIVRRVQIGQSTVSHHLAVLAETRFVLVERSGTARLYRVNDACIRCFPSAADVVMGRDPAIPEEVGSAEDQRPADPHATAITDRYARAVSTTGCAADACGPDLSSFGARQYSADELGDERVLSLGCGNPLRVADLQPGETVLDLGSGAGLDLLLSARRVGPGGRVIGLDMTPEMVELARRNTAGAANVEIRLGRIEDIPLPDASVDVVISNCVLNLSADKPAVLREAARVLRPGGRFGVSDLIADDDVDPDQVATAATAIGTGVRPLGRAAYRDELAAAGLADIRIEPTHDAGGGVLAATIHATKPAVTIRPMRPTDWPAVAAVYAEGIATGNATFETDVPSWERWNGDHLPDHRLVAELGGQVVGWTAVSPVSSRCAYAGVVEHSVYVAETARGHGVGRALLGALVGSTERAGIWTIQTGVFPENEPSLALHRSVGFRVLGVRERPGQLHGRWRDVVLLERRSEAAGG